MKIAKKLRNILIDRGTIPAKVQFYCKLTLLNIASLRVFQFFGTFDQQCDLNHYEELVPLTASCLGVLNAKCAQTHLSHAGTFCCCWSGLGFLSVCLEAHSCYILYANILQANKRLFLLFNTRIPKIWASKDFASKLHSTGGTNFPTSGCGQIANESHLHLIMKRCYTLVPELCKIANHAITLTLWSLCDQLQRTPPCQMQHCWKDNVETFVEVPPAKFLRNLQKGFSLIWMVISMLASYK